MSFGSIFIPVFVLVWMGLIAGALIYPWALWLLLKIIYGIVGPRTWRGRLIRRYQGVGAFAWTFVWFKLRLDAMFRELPEFIRDSKEMRTGLDIGCGYGVAASAILEWRPEMTMVAVDPNPGRVRAVRGALGSRVRAQVGSAPDFEMPEAGRFDLVLMLDMIHYISNQALAATLARVRAGMSAGAMLIVRSNLPPTGAGGLRWKYAALSRRITGASVCMRSAAEIRGEIERAGFQMEVCRASGGNEESYWFIARAGAMEEASIRQNGATATANSTAQ